MKMCFKVLAGWCSVLSFLLSIRGQMVDLSNWDSSGAVMSCEGLNKPWVFEDVTKYPPPSTGSITGSVLTEMNDETRGACLMPENPVTISGDSVFRMQAHVPYTGTSGLMSVWLVSMAASDMTMWYELSGEQMDAWVDICVPRPSKVEDGQYLLEIAITSIDFSVSIRNFGVSNNCDVRTTSTTSEPTSTTPEPTTNKNIGCRATHLYKT